MLGKIASEAKRSWRIEKLVQNKQKEIGITMKDHKHEAVKTTEKYKDHCVMHTGVFLGEHHPSAYLSWQNRSKCTVHVTFSINVQRSYSLPGKANQQEIDQRWRILKGCMFMFLDQKTEATKTKQTDSSVYTHTL